MPQPERASSETSTPTATILIVDDNPLNLQVLVRTFDGTGHRILAARNGRSAVEIAGRALPDLILLDVMMPEMDGFEVCRMVKSNPATRHIVVIFLSALGEVEDKVAGLQLGAADYVTKPIQAEEVLARVANHLAVQRLQRELRASRDELDRELESAAVMQRLLLPDPLPEVGGLRFAAYYETSRHAGGDYYDVLRLPDDQCGIFVADVSGHGAPSAIVMAMIRAVLHSLPEPPLDPSAVMRALNQHFQFFWGGSMLATAVYAVIDARNLQMRIACAGHWPPLLLRQNTVRPLEYDAVPPLLLMDIPSIPCSESRLEAGDRLLFYTDGIVERENMDGAMYGIDRLKAALHKSRTFDLQPLLQSLTADVDAFAGGRETGDDETLLLMAVHSQQ